MLHRTNIETCTICPHALGLGGHACSLQKDKDLTFLSPGPPLVGINLFEGAMTDGAVSVENNRGGQLCQ